MTSRSHLTDLIESIEENVAHASHIEEKLKKAEGEDLIQLKKILKKVLTIRRKKMNRLLEQGEKPNPREWCDLKHALGATKRDWENYEATLDDKDLEIALESDDLLAMQLSRFLGMEFEECSACLYDRLLVQQVLKEKSATIEPTKGDKTNE